MKENININKSKFINKKTGNKMIIEVYTENFLPEITKLSKYIEKYKFIAMVKEET
jgi:hypothetical protein